MAERDERYDEQPQWLMGALAAGDAYRGVPDAWQAPTVVDNPWARGVQRAQDIEAAPPPKLGPAPGWSGNLREVGGRMGDILSSATESFRTPAQHAQWKNFVHQPSQYEPGSEEAQHLENVRNDRAAQFGAEWALNTLGIGRLGGGVKGGLGVGGGKIVQPAPTSELLQRAPNEASGGMFAFPEHVPPTRPQDVREFIDKPQRLLHPGIYKDPRTLAQEAAAMVAPEHSALKKLFGVTREDLYDISQQGTRKGNLDPKLDTKAVRGEGSGSYAADAIMNPRNAQRQIDALAEAERYPQLTHPMDAWYVMDPAFQQMVKLVGREQAVKDYTRFNATTAPFSAGSDVLTEINRGTGANMYAARGDYPTFARYAGVAEKDRGRGFPADMKDIKGHSYHAIQSDPVARYLATGEHGYGDDALKIWLYHQASGVPETGFQTRYPVLDAHLARSTGMSDVRTDAKPGRNMKGAEYRAFAPWYSENVAAPLGIEAVPAQGRQWGVYAPQTGVDTPIGAPKLELIAQAIWERAKRLGIEPSKLRDDVLTGKGHATWLLPALGAGGFATHKMGGLAAQDRYGER